MCVAAEQPAEPARAMHNGLQPRATPIKARSKASGSRRLLPILALGVLSLYGVWFLRVAHTAASSETHEAADNGAGPDPDGTMPVQDDSEFKADFGDAAGAAELAAAEDPASDHKAAEQGGVATAAAVLRAATAPIAAAGSGSGGCRAKPQGAQQVSLFSGTQYVELAASSPVRLDQGELTIAAWVRTAPARGGAQMSIQTVAASKASGCEANEAHHGVSLFVNAWNSNSEQLFFSWGNGASGCEELASEPGAVKAGTWVHVAATVDAHGEAAIYTDGALLAHTAQKGTLGRSRIAGGGSPISRGATSHAMRVGMHNDGTHGFRGHLHALTLLSTGLDAEGVSRLMCQGAARLPSPPLALLVPSDESPPPGVSRVKLALDPSSSGAADGTVRLLPSGAASKPAVITAAKAELTPVALPKTAASQAVASSAPEHFEPAPNGWPLGWLPGKPLPRVSAAAVNASDALAYRRREHVRGVMRRAWNAYRRYAWGADEIKPVSNKSHDWLRLGATMVDCLDNLWIMGMKKEFAEARDWVASNLHFNARGVSMFETVIRIMGGLLSAFELSRDAIFLEKARELADKMMFAFAKNPATGIPCTTISIGGDKGCSYAAWTGHSAVLAEFGTIQIEFKYLSAHTGDRKYHDAVQKIMDTLRRVDKPHGLFPAMINPATGSWTNQKIVFGALGDSFYEYLVKQWLITKKKEPYLREMFDGTMVAMARLLVQKSKPSGLVYIADWSGSSLLHKMDHLACFAAGMLAVGAQDGGKYDLEYMALADKLGETCYEMYARTRTGLAPEFVQFVAGRDMVTGRSAPYNIGRPEAVESFFIMW